MEKKYIVTITREFGSMGRPIARRLSELLNVEFYDRDIVEETARQMNLPLSVVSTNEESQGGIYAKMKSPLGNMCIRDRPYTIVFALLVVISFAWPFIKKRMEKKEGKTS